MSKIEQIEVFIAIVEENSFAGAARRLNVSTAAISRQLARLETELNTELLHRTTRQITLTEIGSQYFELCKTVLSQLQDAELTIANSQKEATGILRVVGDRYFAIKYLIPHLPEFLSLHPKLKVQLELAERFPNFTEENVDILFGVSLEGPQELVRKRIATTRYALCASPAYFAEHGTPKTLADLKKHRYIAHTMRKPSDIITLKNNKEILIEPSLWLNDSRAMRECAIMGLGITKLHDYVVAEALIEKKLIEIFADKQEKKYVYLYYKKNKYLLPKIRRFIDFYSEKIPTE